MIDLFIQKCEKCGWVIPSSLEKTEVRCQKCGHINTIKGFNSALSSLSGAFKTKEDKS
jgi:predicted RNA-binding Zn-ribbon protein involved in translation (DUF1610 family)